MDHVQEAVSKAFAAAALAAENFYNTWGDGGSCGFAWVEVTGVRGNTKLGKALKEAGFEPSWRKGVLQVWNPSKRSEQNIDGKERGADAFAHVIRNALGIEAFACSRLD